MTYVNAFDIAAIANALSSGRPVIYSWNNKALHAHYEVVFTPLDGVRIASDKDAPFGLAPRSTLVSLPQWKTSCAFELFSTDDESFPGVLIQRCLGGGSMSIADACAIGQLLEGVQRDIKFQNIDLRSHP